MQLMKLIQSQDKGDLLSLEAVLLRKREKASARRATRGEVSRHRLLVLYCKVQAGAWPDTSTTKYFSKVHRSVETFVQKHVCPSATVSRSAQWDFLTTQRQVHTLDRMSEDRR